MPLGKSIYSFENSKVEDICPICKKPSYRQQKCAACASKIAKEVEEDFNKNVGHNLTEAILNTRNENLINTVVKGNKSLEDNKLKGISNDTKHDE